VFSVSPVSRFDESNEPIAQALNGSAVVQESTTARGRFRMYGKWYADFTATYSGSLNNSKPVACFLSCNCLHNRSPHRGADRFACFEPRIPACLSVATHDADIYGPIQIISHQNRFAASI
jgi:hypothetical protein